MKTVKEETEEPKIAQDKSIKEGVIYSYQNMNIRILLILSSTLFFWGLSFPLIPKVARDVLSMDSLGYGILLSSVAAGAMLGSVALPLAPKIFRNSKSIVTCIILYSGCMVVFPFSNSLIISVSALVVSGFFHLIWFAVIIILLQTLSDKLHKGRVIGLFFTIIQTYGLGFIIGGFLGEKIGINITIVGASIALVIIHIIAFSSSKEFRVLKS